MTVTLTQLARELGLSPATVSLVLNGKAERFNPDTVKRIKGLAKKYHYRPNGSARAMKRGRFDCFALLHQSGRGRSHLPHALLDGINETLANVGMHLSVGHLSDVGPTDEDSIPQSIRELTADGLIVNYHKNFSPVLQQQLRDAGLPFVWLNADVADAPCLRPDDHRAGVLATEVLLQRGHRHIAYVDWVNDLTIGEHYSAVDRQAGYESAMAAADLPAHSFKNPEKITQDRWSELSDVLLATDNRPTAVVCYSFEIAMHIVLGALGRSRLRLPEDLSVIAIADEVVWGQSLPIDAIVLPWYEIGRMAVMHLRRYAYGDNAALRGLPDPVYHRSGSITAPPQ